MRLPLVFKLSHRRQRLIGRKNAEASCVRDMEDRKEGRGDENNGSRLKRKSREKSRAAGTRLEDEVWALIRICGGILNCKNRVGHLCLFSD